LISRPDPLVWIETFRSFQPASAICLPNRNSREIYRSGYQISLLPIDPSDRSRQTPTFSPPCLATEAPKTGQSLYRSLSSFSKPMSPHVPLSFGFFNSHGGAFLLSLMRTLTTQAPSFGLALFWGVFLMQSCCRSFWDFLILRSPFSKSRTARSVPPPFCNDPRRTIILLKAPTFFLMSPSLPLCLSDSSFSFRALQSLGSSIEPPKSTKRVDRPTRFLDFCTIFPLILSLYWSGTPL